MLDREIIEASGPPSHVDMRYEVMALVDSNSGGFAMLEVEVEDSMPTLAAWLRRCWR